MLHAHSTVQPSLEGTIWRALAPVPPNSSVRASLHTAPKVLCKHLFILAHAPFPPPIR